jgi:hypothetical protein
MRKDRDEWRWRAERLLADKARGFWGRMRNRTKEVFSRVIAHLSALVRTRLATVPQAVKRGPFWFARVKFDEPQDDGTVALAGTGHGPHSVPDGRLDLDEALTVVTLHRPSR